MWCMRNNSCHSLSVLPRGAKAKNTLRLSHSSLSGCCWDIFRKWNTKSRISSFYFQQNSISFQGQLLRFTEDACIFYLVVYVSLSHGVLELYFIISSLGLYGFIQCSFMFYEITGSSNNVPFHSSFLLQCLWSFLGKQHWCQSFGNELSVSVMREIIVLAEYTKPWLQMKQKIYLFPFELFQKSHVHF